MKGLWSRWLVCGCALVGMIAVSGCSYAFSAERNQRRVRVMKRDLELLVDDVDWVLGFDEGSMLRERG